jgi:hypothetical protein
MVFRLAPLSSMTCSNNSTHCHGKWHPPAVVARYYPRCSVQWYPWNFPSKSNRQWQEAGLIRPKSPVSNTNHPYSSMAMSVASGFYSISSLFEGRVQSPHPPDHRAKLVDPTGQWPCFQNRRLVLRYPNPPPQPSKPLLSPCRQQLYDRKKFLAEQHHQKQLLHLD